MSKRTLDHFFGPNTPAKKLKADCDAFNTNSEDASLPSTHPQYPFPIAALPHTVVDAIKASCPSKPGKQVKIQPDLDLLYFEPYFAPSVARELFEFLRRELFYYRVQYKINRYGKEQQVNTPRFTTVFGIDETSLFSADGLSITNNPSNPPDPKSKTTFQYEPRPIPSCLQHLRASVESATSETFNFCLVNYYASGADSIAYHSDDEQFLGPDPTIASFSLGAKRDFLMKHKTPEPGMSPLKFPLASGDCVVMRGKTQPKWLHSIPKRAGKNSEGGRINITFRKAMVREGTNNYYNYNVGRGEPFKWSSRAGEMVRWTAD